MFPTGKNTSVRQILDRNTSEVRIHCKVDKRLSFNLPKSYHQHIHENYEHGKIRIRVLETITDEGSSQPYLPISMRRV